MGRSLRDCLHCRNSELLHLPSRWHDGSGSAELHQLADVAAGKASAPTSKQRKPIKTEAPPAKPGAELKPRAASQGVAAATRAAISSEKVRCLCHGLYQKHLAVRSVMSS